MAETAFLARQRFWNGVVCLLTGAAGLYFGAGLEIGTLSAPGPGAFPLALSLCVSLYGAGQLVAAGVWPIGQPAASQDAPVWFSLVRGGSPGFAFGAVLYGLLLGTSGVDPVTPSIYRYASFEREIYPTLVHGLVLAVVAYHIGFNALLIALGVALSPKIETALRQSPADSGGSLATFFDQPIVLALLVAGVAVVGIRLWLRRKALSAAPSGAAQTHWLARPTFWGAALALLGGAAGLYLGADIAPTVASSDPFFVRAGTYPMALSAALLVLGAALMVRAAVRPAPAGETLLPGSPWSSPATIGAIVILSALAAVFVLPVAFVAMGADVPQFLLILGPAEIAALIVLILALCIVGASLLPGGSFARALSAVIVGFLLSTIGLDPVSGVVRYVAVVDFEIVHGLILGFAGYAVGFNPLLIAVAFAYSDKLESSLRQSLLISDGDPAVFVHRTAGTALLAASVAMLALGAWLRRRRWPRRLSPRPRAR